MKVKTETIRLKKAFVFYRDWAEVLRNYPEDLRSKIFEAILDYALYAKEPTDHTLNYTIFGLIKCQIDRDIEKWEQTCERRREAGRKGAAVTNSLRQARLHEAADTDEEDIPF